MDPLKEGELCPCGNSLIRMREGRLACFCGSTEDAPSSGASIIPAPSRFEG